MKTRHSAVVFTGLIAMSGAFAASFDQTALPMDVQVPAGNKVVMETVGTGDIWYECKVKKEMSSQHEWVFGGPNAVLWDRNSKAVGKYYGPPATWESNDGSKITGTQVAVSPASKGDIPFQLVKANPAMGQGAMTDITYIQRVATKGGVAPTTACGDGNVGAKETVKYQADYIFWKAK